MYIINIYIYVYIYILYLSVLFPTFCFPPLKQPDRRSTAAEAEAPGIVAKGPGFSPFLVPSDGVL